jgi:hypothetical protein
MTLLPEVESALLGAVRAQQRAPRRRLLAPAITAALVSLTLVVAVGALIVLRDHQAGAPASGGNTRAPTSRQQLLDTLGVLRRPQSGPDIKLSDLRFFTTGPFAGTPDLGLLRTVAVPSGARITALLPIRVAATRSAPASEKLDIVIARPTRGRGAQELDPVYSYGLSTVSDLRSEGLAFVPSGPRNVGVLVVPDGVARVLMGPSVHLDLSGLQRRSNRGLTVSDRIAPVTVTVRDNVAGFRLGVVTGHFPNGTRGLFAIPVRLQTTWFAPNGTVVARPFVSTDIFVRMGRPRR